MMTGVEPLRYLKQKADGFTPKIRYNSNSQDIRVSAYGLKFMKSCLTFDPELKRGKGSMRKQILEHLFFMKE